jgi:hypothetical protein
MSDEGNNGANAENTGLLADITMSADKIAFLREVKKEVARATDTDNGGFQTTHTKNSAQAIVKWWRFTRLKARREFLAAERGLKAAGNRMSEEFFPSSETPAEVTPETKAAAPEVKPETKAATPEVISEAKPAPKTEVVPEAKVNATVEARPETKAPAEADASFRKWLQERTAEIQRRVKEEAANTKRRLASSDQRVTQSPVAEVAKPPVVEAPKVDAAAKVETPPAAETKTAAPEVKVEVKPEVKPEVKVEVKAPEVKAPEVHAPETHAPNSPHMEAGHKPFLSTETKFALGTAAVEVAAVSKTSGPSPKKGPGVGAYSSVGLSAFGVVNSVGGLKKSIHEGDGVGITLNSANFTVSAADLTANAFKFAGKADKVFKYVKFLDKANIVMNIADIGYETYKEKGNFINTDADGHTVLGHKSQRLIASTTTAAVSTGAFAIASAAGGGAVAALVLPAAAAIGTAYLANKAANTIIDTERTYEDVDKAFRPDQTRHSNLVGAMARVLGNPEYNKSLIEAGVKVDPETGRASMATLNAALADPEEGKYAMGRFKALIGNIRDKDNQVKEPHMPRWIQFTDAQGKARQDYEYAKMDARSMESALVEADGYVTDLKKKRADAAAKSQAELDASLKPFNALSPEVQEDIVNKMKRDYPAYKQQLGDKALDEAAYVMAGKITAASDPKIVAAFTKAEEDLKPLVQYVADKELAAWQKQNPAAGTADIEAERKQLAADIRHEALKNPAAFQEKIDKFKAAETEQQPTFLLPLAHPEKQPGTLVAQATDKDSAPASKTTARQTPTPA